MEPAVTLPKGLSLDLQKEFHSEDELLEELDRGKKLVSFFKCAAIDTDWMRGHQPLMARLLRQIKIRNNQETWNLEQIRSINDAVQHILKFDEMLSSDFKTVCQSITSPISVKIEITIIPALFWPFISSSGSGTIDASPSVLLQVCDYLQHGMIKPLDKLLPYNEHKNHLQLLEFAKQQGLHDLSSKVLQKIKISFENLLELLLCAEKCSLSDLKRECFAWVNEHFPNLIRQNNESDITIFFTQKYEQDLSNLIPFLSHLSQTTTHVVINPRFLLNTAKDIVDNLLMQVFPTITRLDCIEMTEMTINDFFFLATLCKKLRYLDFGTCPQVGDIHLTNISKCNTELRSLTFKEASITDEGLGAISHFTLLNDLDLTDCCEISNNGLIYLSTILLELHSLKLANHFAVGDDGIKHLLAKSTSLRNLDIKMIPTLTDEGIAAFGRAKRLSSLKIKECSKITEKGILEGLKMLQEQEGNATCGITEIELELEEITDQGLKTIVKLCPKLKMLHIKARHSSQLTEKGLIDFANTCSDLNAFSLEGYKQLTPDAIIAISNMPLLRSLILRGTPINNAMLEKLAHGARKITTLDLTGSSSLDDKACGALGEYCIYLEHLLLPSCEGMTDEGLKSIATGCKKLSTIDLSNNKHITVHGISMILQACQVMSLNISGCEITEDHFIELIERGSIPTKLILRGLNHLTDQSLIKLSQDCDFIKALDLQDCEKISLVGIAKLKARCRELSQLQYNERLSICNLDDLSQEELLTLCQELDSAKGQILLSKIMHQFEEKLQVSEKDIKPVLYYAYVFKSDIIKERCRQFLDKSTTGLKLSENDYFTFSLRDCIPEKLNMVIEWLKYWTSSFVLPLELEINPEVNIENLSKQLQPLKLYIRKVHFEFSDLYKEKKKYQVDDAALQKHTINEITLGHLIAFLAMCPNLQILHLPNCAKLSPDLIKPLVNCRELVELDFNGSKNVEENFIRELEGNFPKIKSLNLSTTPLSNEMLKEIGIVFPDLIDLNISYCGHADGNGIVNALRLCRNLKSLKIAHCPLEDRHISEIGHILGNLRILDLTGSSFSEKGLLNIFQMSQSLVHLSLKSCRAVNDLILFSLAIANRRLTKLTLENCPQITDDGILEVVKKCIQLTELNVSDCDKLSDISLANIGTYLPNLTSLDFGSPCFQDSHPSQKYRWERNTITDDKLALLVRSCASLRTLRLAGRNEITNKGISEIAQQAKSLQELDVMACDSLSYHSIFKLVVWAPKIQTLNLVGCRHMQKDEIVRLCSLYPYLNIKFDISHTLLRYHVERLHESTTVLTAQASITDENLIELTRTCPKIQQFYLTGCCLMSDKSLDIIARGFKELVEIDLTDCYQVTSEGIITMVKRNPRIRNLDLSGCSKIDDKALEAIAEHCISLTKLVFYKNDKITESGLQTIIARRKGTLKDLFIKECKNIASQNVHYLKEMGRPTSHVHYWECKAL